MNTGAGGARRLRRRVDGIVLLDKPSGISSNRALQRARYLLQAEKAGHAGTLDPMATGMLPLCFGQATKACGQLLGASKAYRGQLRLGTATDTADAEGSVITTVAVPRLTEAVVREVLEPLHGPREQVPPMYSALKHQGRRLYDLARRGMQVERQARAIRIDRLELLELTAETIEFEVHCSKGTYIRVLAEEIAVALGTVGHLGALRRLWVEPFRNQTMVAFEEIERWRGETMDPGVRPPWMHPIDLAFAGLPRIDLCRDDAGHLRQGRVIQVAAGTPDAERAAVYDPLGVFLGLVTVAGGEMRVVRLFVPGASGKSIEEA